MRVRAARAVVARRLLTLAKCILQKRCVGTIRSFRKKTEGFGRGLRQVLVKKGCKKGGVSLQRAYRKLIRILDDWYRKGIQRVDSQYDTTSLKMEKTGFRGERKRKRHQALGHRQQGECDGKSKETSPFSHTPLSRCTYPAVAGYLNEGECSDEKREEKLGNQQIRKLVNGEVRAARAVKLGNLEMRKWGGVGSQAIGNRDVTERKQADWEIRKLANLGIWKLAMRARAKSSRQRREGIIRK